MATDQCSKMSYDDIRRSGYVGRNQARYLSVFVDSIIPMTHREATESVSTFFGVRQPARNGRIAELEQMGFITKHDTTVCAFTHKRVNRWVWTGRTKPLPSRDEWTVCPHCNGEGGYVDRVYYKGAPSPQEDLFDKK